MIKCFLLRPPRGRLGRVFPAGAGGAAAPSPLSTSGIKTGMASYLEPDVRPHNASAPRSSLRATPRALACTCAHVIHARDAIYEAWVHMQSTPGSSATATATVTSRCASCSFRATRARTSGPLECLPWEHGSTPGSGGRGGGRRGAGRDACG